MGLTPLAMCCGIEGFLMLDAALSLAATSAGGGAGRPFRGTLLAHEAPIYSIEAITLYSILAHAAPVCSTWRLH